MQMLSARQRADLLVTSEDGQPQLVVETKRKPGDTAALVAAAHAQFKSLAQSCFFLLVTPDKFWLWAPSAEAPAYEGNTAALLERYINLDKIPLNSLEGREFVLVVYSWLGSVIFKPADVLSKLPAQRWLVDTGLHPLIYRGYIQLEAELTP